MSTPITDTLPLPQIYFQSVGPVYWVQDDTEKWIGVNETSARARVRGAGFAPDRRDAQGNSEADNCLLRIQDSQNIAYAGSLAGYQAGLYQIHRRQVLVTESPRLIVPQAGQWPMLSAIIEGMFNDEQCDQRPYLYGWLKRGLECYRSGLWSPGQVVAMAGPVASAKSLLQSVFTEMFGGRAAKPYLYMTGKTTFNADLFGAEHLVVEDEAESTDIRARRHFGSRIKEVAVNRDQHCHGKGKAALTLTPVWRMTISLNDEPERLMVLPPLDTDVADKIMLFKVRKRDLPMPTETAEEKQRFWNALVAELPAFMDFLYHYEIPVELRSRRFGIMHYHHPELVEALAELNPETHLRSMIISALFVDRLTLEEWEGGSLELRQILCDGNEWRHLEARKLLNNANACGSYLRRLADDPTLHDQFTGRKVRGQQIWTIRPPAPEGEV